MAFLDERHEGAQSSDPTPPPARRVAAAPHLGSLSTREHDTRTLLALQALTDTALSHLSLDVMLPELLERLRTVMQVDNAAILLMDDETNELVVQVASGPEEEVVGKARIPFAEGFAGRIAATRQPLFVEDLSTYPVKNPLLRQRLHSVLGVPLIADDRVLGVVHIGAVGPRHFTDDDEALLTQVADRIARAVERGQLYAEAREARRLAEERASFLNTTLESLGDGLVITDAQGDVLYANPAYLDMMGEGARGSGALSGNVPSRMRALDVRDANGAPLSVSELGVSRALRGETLAGPTALEVQIRRLDGQQVIVSVTGSPVRDADGVIIGAVMALRDVTERRRLERHAFEATNQATERARRLEAIFAAVGDGLFVYDAEGNIVESNPAAAAMLNMYSSGKLGEGSVHDRTRRLGGLRDITGHPLPVDEWPQARVGRGESLVGQASEYIRLRRADGEDTYLNVSGAPLRDESGAIVGSVCLYRDLTERWMLNETLQERTTALEAANARLRTLLDVLPVAVAITDAEGKGLEVNAAFYRIWGSDAPLLGEIAQYSTYRGWRVATGEPLRPGDWPITRALATGEPVPGEEIEIETFSGERKFALITATPLRDAAGKISGGIVAMLDITEQKLRTERTRAALEAFIAITQTLVDPPDDPHKRGEREVSGGGDQSRDSAAARRIAELAREVLGCSRVSITAVEGEDLRQHPVMIVGLSPELERQWWEEQRALAGQPLGTGAVPEDRERLRAGETVTFDLTRPPYLIPNPYGVTSILAAPMRVGGRIVGLLGLDFEEPGDQPHSFTPEEIQITEAIARLGAVVLERERLLREREAAHARALALAEANRRMDEFLGIAGHELRTPLTTLKLNLQLADRRARGALQGGPEDTAASQTEHATLTHVLRLLERAEISVRRQERLVQDLLDVSRISSGKLEFRMAQHDLRDIAHDVVEEQRLGAPNRKIPLTMPEQPVLVSADGDRVGQVLTNYLTNALKYSRAEHPVKVSVRVRGSRARVEVRDEGPGLTPAQRRHLFERFHRVEGIEVLSGSGIGLGLGLYISKTIAEHHGGSVGVTSALGKGSTFWFELPLADDEDVTSSHDA